jgi:hypothetical protein
MTRERGTILLKCRNGDHKALTVVYLIPRLTTNIVSLGQLEEAGYRIVLFGGYLKIWDAKGQLVANVARVANRLYALELNIARPVCLATQGNSATGGGTSGTVISTSVVSVDWLRTTWCEGCHKLITLIKFVIAASP